MATKKTATRRQSARKQPAKTAKPAGTGTKKNFFGSSEYLKTVNNRTKMLDKAAGKNPAGRKKGS